MANVIATWANFDSVSSKVLLDLLFFLKLIIAFQAEHLQLSLLHVFARKLIVTLGDRRLGVVSIGATLFLNLDLIS